MRCVFVFLLAIPIVARAQDSIALKRPELPPPQAGHNQPIDRFVDAYLAAHKLPFPPPVDDATFARRVYLDLVGLLPHAGQIPAISRRSGRRQARSPGRRAAGQQHRLRRPLADVLERSSAQRLLRHRLHRWRPQANHALAVRLAVGKQAVRSIRSRIDFSVARIRRFYQRLQMARHRQRRAIDRTAIRTKRRPGVPRRESQVRFVPR